MHTKHMHSRLMLTVWVTDRRKASSSAVQECSRSPLQVSAERDSASTIRQQEGDLQKLRDQVSVLAHAKETDGRRFRHIATERHRERQDLRAEMDRLKV